jgi:hypothetical protein
MSTGVYQKTAGELINSALRAASISGIQLAVDASDFATGQEKLNDILAWLQTKQIHLWSNTEAFLPLNPNQRTYTLPSAHCFTDYVATTTSAAYIASDTAFTVATTTGMTVGDFIGIELASGSRWWDTIATIPTSTTLTTTGGATSAINSGAIVYTYTTAIDQPVRILDARFQNQHDESETTISQLSRQEYYEQPEKSSIGSANSWYYDRQLSAGKLSLWPVAQDCNEVVRFTFIKPQYIPEDQSENILIPPEWYMPLMYKLASELGVVYSIDPNKQVILEQKAANFIEDALGTDNEFSSFSFYPSGD